MKKICSGQYDVEMGNGIYAKVDSFAINWGKDWVMGNQGLIECHE